MKKSSSRLVFLIVALLMTAAGLAGCASQPQAPTTAPAATAAASASAAASAAAATPAATAAAEEPGWKKDTSPITFDWYICYSWFTNASIWDTAIVPQYITKKTGVKLNIVIPSGDDEEKLNTLIASDSLPDYVTVERTWEAVRKMEEGKLVYALNDLADQYEPYFYKVIAPSSFKWFSRADGKTYGYPNFSEAPEQATGSVQRSSNQTFLVRKDIYTAIGSPDMTTPDGFVNALKAAKDKYPTVGGQPLIPFVVHEFVETGSWSLDEILCNFLAVPYWDANGKLYDRVTDPEYLRWMKALRKANEMGLISKDIFIDKRAQIEENTLQGRYFSMLYQWTDVSTQNLARYQQDPNSCYIAVDAFRNSKGDAPTLRGGSLSGWTLSYISKKNKDPKRAIEFMTYMLSVEGAHDFWLGEKGVTYDTVDGKDQFKPEVSQLLTTDRDAFDKKYGGHDTFWMLVDPFITQPWDVPVTDPMKQNKEWTYGKVVSLAAVDDINPPLDSEEGVIGTKIGELWGQTQTKMILAKSDSEFDQVVQDFITKRAALGWDKLLAYQQAKFEENRKKLGE